jgi:hypothetical protein
MDVGLSAALFRVLDANLSLLAPWLTDVTRASAGSASTLAAREAISTGLRSDGLACSGILCMRCHAASCGRSGLLSRRLDPAQQQAGVAFSLYDLRHTSASRLLAAGIPLIEVSAWMGHGLRAGGHEITNTTTRVYAHATGGWRQAAACRAVLLPGQRSWTPTAGDESV